MFSNFWLLYGTVVLVGDFGPNINHLAPFVKSGGCPLCLPSSYTYVHADHAIQMDVSLAKHMKMYLLYLMQMTHLISFFCGHI